MDRRNYYYGQIVQEDELDVGFANGEEADWKQNYDVGLVGIQIPAYNVPAAWPALPVSWTVDEAVPPSWKVSIDTGYAYNKDGKRMAVDPPTTVELDCEKDYLGVNNSVGVGNQRWIAIFLKYTKTLSDPRVDDLGATVYFVETESYELECRQAAEELIAIPPAIGTQVPLDSTSILIADILIDNGMPPINTGDIDLLTRVESLMKLDLSGLQPAAYGGTKTTVRGRNLDEILYSLMDMLMDIPQEGQLPKTTCLFDLGSVALNWRKLYIQSINETPEVASGVGNLRANATMEGALGHSQIMKSIQPIGLAGVPHENRDIAGRRRIHALEDFEDFLEYPTHPGPFPYQLTFGGTGASTLNAGGAAVYPCGYRQLNTPAQADIARIVRGSYPLNTQDQPNVEWGMQSLVTSAKELISVGMRTLTQYLHLVYDPTGILNPGVANGNWWAVYDDGGANPAIWTDTTVAFAVTTVFRLEVAFEYEIGTGNLWAYWYIETGASIVTTRSDLTTLGGTYQAVAEAADWDIGAYVDASDVAAGGEQVAFDFYRARQHRVY